MTNKSIAKLLKDGKSPNLAAHMQKRYVLLEKSYYVQALTILEQQPKCETCKGTKEIEKRGYSDEGVYIGHIKIPCPDCKPTICKKCEHNMYCTHERKQTLNKEGKCPNYNHPFNKSEPREFTKQARKDLPSLQNRTSELIGLQTYFFWIRDARDIIDSLAEGIEQYELHHRSHTIEIVNLKAKLDSQAEEIKRLREALENIVNDGFCEVNARFWAKHALKGE